MSSQWQEFSAYPAGKTSPGATHLLSKDNNKSPMLSLGLDKGALMAVSRQGGTPTSLLGGLLGRGDTNHLQ